MNDRENQDNYIIGVYVRESRDDNEENYETIETQRGLLIDFIERSRLGRIYKVYIDDNVSGSRFERQGIEQLKEDVTAGRISLLVLKDLSRLGRSNAKTLLFLDFLEEYGVRVITFDGRYDSLKDNDTVGIDTWYNERYIRDISKKIRANLRFKIERGEYIGHAPYGYIKSTEQKNKLCIDETAARVVREIYNLYKEGYGYSCIAKLLDSKEYTPPSGKSGIIGKAKSWTAVAVQRILCNRVYIGDTVQGISEKVSFKSKKTRRLPFSKWVVTRNTHEAIISQGEFEEVQRIRSDRRAVSGPHKGKLHLFRGKLYCGRCGSVMFARVRKDRPMGYICGNYSKNGAKSCSSHYISEQQIAGILAYDLTGLLGDKEVAEKAISLLQKELDGKADFSNEIHKLEQQMAGKQKQQDILYSDRLDGKISEQLFSRMNQNIESRINLLQCELDRLSSKKGSEPDVKQLFKQVSDKISMGDITYQIVNIMVDKIEVYDEGDECADIDGISYQMKEQIEENGAVIIYYKFRLKEEK